MFVTFTIFAFQYLGVHNGILSHIYIYIYTHHHHINHIYIYIFMYDPVHFTSIIVQHHRCSHNHVARAVGQKPTAADVADLADSVALRSASGGVTNAAKSH